MSLTKLKQKTEGFTIIEVLIVLAIAGLIMVIVFVAVPQLQRSQRNNARDNDATLITSTISDCLANKNGVQTSCDTPGTDINFPTNLKEVTAATYTNGAGSTSAANYQFGLQCTADGQGTQGGTTRQFVVRYQVEGGNGNVNKCISG